MSIRQKKQQPYLIADVIGLATWETVDIIHKGANYGYSEREGNERLKSNNRTEALPADDRLPMRVGDEPGTEMVKPTYPVLLYPHKPGGGDAISSGVCVRGQDRRVAGQVHLRRHHHGPHLVGRSATK